MAENYTYNPSQSISESFKDTSGGIANIFKAIVDRKKRDYDIAENVYTNIEALKEKVNMYGRQDITNKANELTAQLSDAIKEGGTLDSAKTALIAQKVRQIKLEKQAWEDKAELRKEYQTKVLSQKDMIPNIEKALMDGDKITMDKNILNPQDATKHFDEAFMNNLDQNAVLQRAYQTIRPKSNINGMKTNKDKSIISFTGTGYLGDSYDPVTKTRIRPATTPQYDPATQTTIQVPTEDYDYQQMEKTHPQVIDLLVKKAGAAADLLPADQRRKIILNQEINKLPIEVKETYKAPPKPPKVKQATDSDKEAGGYAGSLKVTPVTLPDGTVVNSIPIGKALKAKINGGKKGVITEVAKDSKGAYYGLVSYKPGTEIIWTDEDQEPEGGVDTRWVKMDSPSFISDLDATARLSLKGKFGGVFINAAKKIPAPKLSGTPAPTGGGTPAPAGGGAHKYPQPTGSTATKIAFYNKKGEPVTEGMLWAILKAKNFSVEKYDYINQNKK
jgi:hypothetical protein